ncbi:hypothetical protein DFH08DRAFT_826723 [Mycena albidolilacea]|uniref:Uncharacterized protein n=1 Tax=Mycena albidolilacea TaxID=1033008 RepID=A0AAD7E7Z1_9AGAR|nr:hypothetical protein DFH08DRAFT_826723 [Mycena albidolilacea]
MSVPVASAPPPPPTVFPASYSPMSFCPSIKEVDESEEPRGAPPLQLSSYILLGANEPDLPIAFDSPLKRACSRTYPSSHLTSPQYNTSPIASQDPAVTVDHGEYLGVSTPGVAPDCLTTDTFLSENAPDSGSITEPSVELAARARLPGDMCQPPLTHIAVAETFTALFPSATALGKRAAQLFQFTGLAPAVATHYWLSVLGVQFRPDEALHRYNGHTPYNPTMRNVHTGNDPALTTQSVRAAVPDASIALMCTDIPKLVQLYRYFTAPTLSDLAARHCLQTSTRLLSLISIIAEHQLKCPWTVKHNLVSSSHFFEMVFDNSPHDNGPSVVSTYNLNRHFEFVTIGDGPTMELMYGNSSGHSICRTSSLAEFVGHFVYLNISQLNSIATLHTAQTVNSETDKPALIQSLLHHFIPHSVSEEAHSEGGPYASMSDLEVLPLLTDNHMQVNEGDGRDHVSIDPDPVDIVHTQSG